MNELIKKGGKIIKNPKCLMLLGFIGIGLIFISSFIPSGKNSAKNTSSKGESSASIAQYRDELEKSVKKIVAGITGDEDAAVVVTLESGIRYTYADTTKTDSSSATGSNTNQESESLSKGYITVKGSDGSEQPLLITEIMPQVRGVAVICRGGNDEQLAEKIIGAVTAAFNITEKRVYISGGTQ